MPWARAVTTFYFIIFPPAAILFFRSCRGPSTGDGKPLYAGKLHETHPRYKGFS